MRNLISVQCNILEASKNGHMIIFRHLIYALNNALTTDTYQEGRDY